jgi:uncharacterized protein (DUF2249 family)
MSTTTAQTIDLRALQPRDRHALIFASFDALQAGESLRLVNDHDPRPLRFQLEDRTPGQFAWSYVEAGPSVWRVRIDKLSAGAKAAAQDSCCSGGACGG